MSFKGLFASYRIMTPQCVYGFCYVLVAARIVVNADQYSGITPATIIPGCGKEYESHMIVNVYRKMSPRGIDVKLYLTIDQFNGTCPVDDSQYEYMEKFAIHDMPPTVDRDTVIDFNVSRVRSDWKLKSCTSCGLEPRKLSTRLQCPVECKKIPEAAALSFERNTLSDHGTLTFLLSVNLDDFPYTNKNIELHKAWSVETILLIAACTVVGVLLIVCPVVCYCRKKRKKNQRIQREETPDQEKNKHDPLLLETQMQKYPDQTKNKQSLLAEEVKNKFKTSEENQPCLNEPDKKTDQIQRAPNHGHKKIIKKRRLIDDAVDRISLRITEKTKLRELAIKLDVDSYDVQRAFEDHRKIEEAAHEVLNKWKESEGNEKVALRKLYKALCEAGLTMIANDVLRQQKEDAEKECNEGAQSTAEPEPERPRHENEGNASV